MEGLFNPVNIRMTARKMNLPSEASQRYEKRVDPEGAIFAQNRAVRLMKETAGGRILRGIIDKYPCPVKKREIILRKSKIQEVLGYSLPEDRVTDIFTGLSLVVKTAGGEKGKEPDYLRGKLIFMSKFHLSAVIY